MIVSILQLMGFGAAAPKPEPAHPPGGREVKPQAAQTKSGAKSTSVAVKGAKAVVKKLSTVKSSPKLPVKLAAKPAFEMPAKPSAKAVAAKPVTSAKPSSPKAVTKTVSKTAVKPTVKPVAQSVKKADAKAKVSAPSVVPKPAVKPVSAKTLTPKAAAAPVVPVKATPAVAAKLAAVPVSATSARSKVPTSIRTVGKTNAKVAPSMASDLNPTVASTAAKSSYKASSFPVMPSPVFAVSAPTKKDPKLANNWKTKPVDQLTDAEVLAMADDDYMNDAQMAFFKLKLNHLKQDILSSAGETTEHLREDTVVVPDPADRATIEEEHALELRTRDRERKLLKKIEQSIARIDAGDYGYCDETGEPIGVGRLLARPTANLSLEAQQRRELKQKMFGD
ncbi:MAG: RNA polymerase-binding protein DksA [Betaproteobacteria bacterium]|jgi:DnaK suppressor protein|nr:RNA polymerase-binding protein DksA [Betaproteobacteria bacterium]MBK7657282.1 RNA polymerase-binding protein DksA [Betaproteobacteria bacterium]MBP6646805.1 RNA polymerase-binding protein DksA [Burkholderiaceae bacterium]